MEKSEGLLERCWLSGWLYTVSQFIHTNAMLGNPLKTLLTNTARFLNPASASSSRTVSTAVHLSDLTPAKGSTKTVRLRDSSVSYISILINICRIRVTVEVLEVKRAVHLDEVTRVKKRGTAKG